jgi:hypothetical protein
MLAIFKAFPNFPDSTAAFDSSQNLEQTAELFFNSEIRMKWNLFYILQRKWNRNYLKVDLNYFLLTLLILLCRRNPVEKGFDNLDFIFVVHRHLHFLLEIFPGQNFGYRHLKILLTSGHF